MEEKVITNTAMQISAWPDLYLAELLLVPSVFVGQIE